MVEKIFQEALYSGHKKVFDYFNKSIEKKKLSHAYLFLGPEGVGKKEAAVNFLRRIICQKKKNSAPCLKCQSCQIFRRKTSADFLEIKKKSDKKNISIEQIRALIDHLSLKPLNWPYKFALIDQAELMSESASNSFLKTLEEPSDKTIIILIASNKNRLPETITSRCQTIRFNFISHSLIFDYLKKSQLINNQKASSISQIVQGRISQARKMARDNEYFESYQETINRFLNLFSFSLADRFKEISSLYGNLTPSKNSFINYHSLINIWLTVLRDLLLYQSDQENKITFVFKKNIYKKIIKGKKDLYFKKLIDHLIVTKMLIDRNLNPKIVLENFILKI
ncbi:MAG: DNA polymerase III subunit [Patescibacteria group bacterium]|nr:DNA polymerase III subunit [Patescibacteria group bacterium]